MQFILHFINIPTILGTLAMLKLPLLDEKWCKFVKIRIAARFFDHLFWISNSLSYSKSKSLLQYVNTCVF